MKRRKFLGFLGGAAVAGPAAAQTAATAAMSDLAIAGNIAYGGLGAPTMGMSISPEGGNHSWAKEQLKRLLGRSAVERSMRKQRHGIYSLDPHYAACRSISLVNKIRLSIEADFERNEARERTYYQGVIDRLWE